MFQFKLMKKSQIGIYLLSDFSEAARGLFSFIKFHSHKRCKMAQRTVCTQHNSSIFHAHMFCANKHTTGHRVECGRSRDSRKWLTPNVAEHLWHSFKISEFTSI